MKHGEFLTEIRNFCDSQEIKIGFRKEEVPPFTQLHTLVISANGMMIESHLTISDFFNANEFYKQVSDPCLNNDRNFHHDYDKVLAVSYRKNKKIPETFQILLNYDFTLQNSYSGIHNYFYIRSEYYDSLGGNLTSYSRIGFFSIVDALKVQNYIYLNPKLFKDYLKSISDNSFSIDEKEFNFDSFAAPYMTYGEAKDIEENIKELATKFKILVGDINVYKVYVEKEKNFNKNWEVDITDVFKIEHQMDDVNLGNKL